MTKLTSEMLNDLVKSAYGHKPEKVDGKRFQDVDIPMILWKSCPKACLRT